MTVALEPTPKTFATGEDVERLTRQGERCELIFGELVPMPPVGNDQGVATNDLASEAAVFVRRNKLGRGFAAETGFRLSRDPETILAPDWAFIRAERIEGPPARGFGDLVPDLVLETRSPNDSKGEVAGKIGLWLHFGAQVVWDLDPARKILTVHRRDGTVTRLGAEDTLTEEELLPGFSLPLSEIFEN